MSVVINFEYLVSPVLYSPGFFNKTVEDIRLLSELFTGGISIAFIEENAVIKMQEHNFFPSLKVYQRIISQLEEDPSICANDIVRMVNVILSRSEEFSDSHITHIVEWANEVTIMPQFSSISEKRFNELKNFYINLSIENEFAEKKYSSLYYNLENPLCEKKIGLKGNISNIFPEKVNEYPYKYNSNIELLSDINSIFLKMDGFNMYKSSDTPLKMKLSLYVGTLQIIKKNNLDIPFSWDSFKVGSSFIDSLKKNECHSEQQFSSSVFILLINLLANTGKAEVDYFYKSDDPDKPRTLGHLIAYRVHVTKTGRALRLLFWKDADNDVLILANVGNKSELEILAP